MDFLEVANSINNSVQKGIIDKSDSIKLIESIRMIFEIRRMCHITDDLNINWNEKNKTVDVYANYDLIHIYVFEGNVMMSH